MADPLYLFGVTVADSDELQDMFSRCTNLADVMEVIDQEGLGLSYGQLYKYARRHDEPWWPWAGRSDDWKEEFFQRRMMGEGPLSLLGDLIEVAGLMLSRRREDPRRSVA